MWVVFDCFVEVGEFVWVMQEEYWCVVVDQVLVVFFGVEFQGEVVDVMFGVGGVMFVGYCGEVGEYFGLFVDFFEQFGVCVLGDVVGDGEGIECV